MPLRKVGKAGKKVGKVVRERVSDTVKKLKVANARSPKETSRKINKFQRDTRTFLGIKNPVSQAEAKQFLKELKKKEKDRK